MPNPIDDVAEFHAHADSPFPNDPQLPPAERRGLVLALITEEYTELTLAAAQGDFAGYADGLVDIVWVALQGLFEAGLNVDQVHALFDEVGRANLSKVVGPLLDDNNGEVYRNEIGKITKPPGFTPPDIKGLLELFSRG